jgi:TolB-like protein
MSPEQAAGDKGIDARTDVYSLGAVLYEMLAGEAPFTGATAQAIAAKRLTEPPPSVRSVRTTVPDSVDQAIRKALAPVPADRFAGAAALAQALAPAERRNGGTADRSAEDTVVRSPVEVSAVPPFRRSATFARILGLLIGGGILFAWRHSRPEAMSSGERRIAVIPFQNLGDSADAYFADGITDAIRGKLTALPGMRVTASNSSAQYRNTGKTPQEIGRELGVDYLLVGKVRWAKAGGTSRVQVSPELIEVATADAKWQQPFDAALTDVFKVQADVAGEVAQALDVAIGSRQQEVLADRPTANLAAYDAYLKGQAFRAFGPIRPRCGRRSTSMSRRWRSTLGSCRPGCRWRGPARSCTATARPRPRWLTEPAPPPNGPWPSSPITLADTGRWAATTGSSPENRNGRSSSTPRGSPSPRAMPISCGHSAWRSSRRADGTSRSSTCGRARASILEQGTRRACSAVRCSGSGVTPRRWRRPIVRSRSLPLPWSSWRARR